MNRIKHCLFKQHQELIINAIVTVTDSCVKELEEPQNVTHNHDGQGNMKTHPLIYHIAEI